MGLSDDCIFKKFSVVNNKFRGCYFFERKFLKTVAVTQSRILDMMTDEELQYSIQSAKVIDLQKNVLRLQATLRHLESTNEAMQKTFNETIQRQHDLESKEHFMTKQLEEAAQTIETKNAEIKDLKDKIDAAAQKITNKDVKIIQLEATIEAIIMIALVLLAIVVAMLC